MTTVMHNRFRHAAVAITATACSLSANAADVDAPFRFEAIDSLDAMTRFVHQRFVIGTLRDDLRRVFVTDGQATLVANPVAASTEKYVYDIDLCGYYVWRWNVSADYGPDHRLLQAWVNGEPVYADGPQKGTPPTDATGRNQAVVKGVRERPEAIKGESSLVYTILDPDVASKSAHRTYLTGTGPSKPNPVDFGATHVYTNVDPWRSIFDTDPASEIVGYDRSCRTVDATLKRMFTKPMGN
jgi:hypothetical protein